MDIDTAIKICYRSGAIAFATANTKRWVCNEKRNVLRQLVANTEDEETRRRYVRLFSGYRNLIAFFESAEKFYSYGAGGEGTGLKDNLEDLWESMGNKLEDLPSWDQLSTLKLSRVTSFDNAPPAGSFDLWVSELYDNTSEIYHEEDSYRDQMMKIFDLGVEDLWRAEAWRRWIVSVIDESQFSGADLLHWGWIIEGARQYFQVSNRCMNDIADILDLHDNAESQNHVGRREQYTYVEGGSTPNSLDAKGGLYACIRADIPTEWQNQVEQFNVSFE